MKVADFGIAQAFTDAQLTMPGMTMGSVHYFSPEQARGELVTTASDIYSAGLVLYEMLTGQRAFTGDSAGAVAVARLAATAAADRSAPTCRRAGRDRPRRARPCSIRPAHRRSAFVRAQQVHRGSHGAGLHSARWRERSAAGPPLAAAAAAGAAALAGGPDQGPAYGTYAGTYVSRRRATALWPPAPYEPVAG